MKFKFSLQGLMRHRKNLEEMARRNFSEAKSVSDGHLKSLEEMHDSTDKARDYTGDALSEQVSDPASLQLAHEFIEGNKIRIERKKVDFRESLATTEKKQEELVAAAKETKILEKLREKRLKEFKQKIRKAERKAIDELVVQRHGRGKANGQ